MQAIAFGLTQDARRIGRKNSGQVEISQPRALKDVNRSSDERLLPIGHCEKKENCLVVGKCGVLRSWDN
jgi:hypothetical protein